VKTSLLRSNSYAEAKDWGDLVYAFTESLKDSPLDEFIHLMDINIPGPQGRRPEYVRPVSYYTLDEVPELLRSITPSALRTGATPTHQRRQHVGAATQVRPEDDHNGQGQQEFIVAPQEWIADGEGAEVGASDWFYDVPQERGVGGEGMEAVMSSEDREQEISETRASAAKVIQDAYRRHLEQKRAGAARKIQAAYRHYLERKTPVGHYWYLLRKRSAQMEWPKSSRYHLLFRLPLAYVLVCLDAIKAFVETEKKEAKKRVMTEDDRGLEELMKALAQHRSDSIDHTLFSRA
jgi:hypothetical protein